MDLTETEPTRSAFQGFALVVAAVVLAILAFASYLTVHYKGITRSPGWAAAYSDGTWRVATVQPGGPADQLLLPGDRILAIDGDVGAGGLDPDVTLRFKRSSEGYTLSVDRNGQTRDVLLRFETRFDYHVLLWSASLLLVALVFFFFLDLALDKVLPARRAPAR